MSRPIPFDRRVRDGECLGQYIDRAICGVIRGDYWYTDFIDNLVPYIEPSWVWAPAGRPPPLQHNFDLGDFLQLANLPISGK